MINCIVFAEKIGYSCFVEAIKRKGGMKMSKKPVDLFMDGVKKYGPQAGKLVKDHQKEIKGVLGALGVGEKDKKHKEKKEASNKTKGK